jgi:hypothetical protein
MVRAGPNWTDMVRFGPARTTASPRQDHRPWFCERLLLLSVQRDRDQGGGLLTCPLLLSRERVSGGRSA